MNARAIFLSVTLLTLPAVLLRPAPADSQDSVKLFISVDLEGISCYPFLDTVSTCNPR